MAKKPTQKEVKKPSLQGLVNVLNEKLKKSAKMGTIYVQDLLEIMQVHKKYFTPDGILHFVQKYKIKFCANCQAIFKSTLEWLEPPANIFRPVQN